ncbi:hypothetical protein AB0H83_05045 [Dactylosporangium sp. NPDC050688]|uniref:hypothetical protein n=1 Tax=Dactylosporangium sp. NPDC050688 TaxID=3157217 RepID=UPI0033EAB0A7
MSDTKPLPDDPDRTAPVPAHPAPATSGPAPTAAAPTASGPAPTAAEQAGPAPAEPVDLTPGEPVWAAEPAPAPAATTAHPAGAHPTGPPAATDPGRFRSAGSGLRRSRAGIPVLVGVVALVLGCCLGAGVVAVGAFVFGDGHRGDDRGRFSRDERAPRGGPAFRDDDRDGRKPARPGHDGTRRRPSPAVTPPAPATPSPAAPSSPATS